MSKADELKPCPFCGKEAWLGNLPMELERGAVIYRVGCSDSECIGYETMSMEFDSKDDALAAWNRRPGCDGCRHNGTPASDKGFICLYCTRNFLDLYEPNDNDEEEE